MKSFIFAATALFVTNCFASRKTDSISRTIVCGNYSSRIDVWLDHDRKAFTVVSPSGQTRYKVHVRDADNISVVYEGFDSQGNLAMVILDDRGDQFVVGDYKTVYPLSCPSS